MLAHLFSLRLPHSADDLKRLAKFFSDWGFESAEDLVQAELLHGGDSNLHSRLRKLASALVEQATQRLEERIKAGVQLYRNLLVLCCLPDTAAAQESNLRRKLLYFFRLEL